MKNEWGKKERSRGEDCSREKKKKKKAMIFQQSLVLVSSLAAI